MRMKVLIGAVFGIALGAGVWYASLPKPEPAIVTWVEDFASVPIRDNATGKTIVGIIELSLKTDGNVGWRIRRDKKVAEQVNVEQVEAAMEKTVEKPAKKSWWRKK